ncbi:Alanine--tRNA ligase [Moraxella lacunata]|uniref:Alanine--tRNA ligase n=1 Tax=Moraxella lacunata TaxID=477 RepID=A0A378TTY9_MORLA|nr:alanine--tRNA ligase [Moraxella lacunata]STZ63754.1 Alanine--tRNA ligase [Moraxella lacunata]
MTTAHLTKTMQLAEVRQAFIDFFKSKNHTHVESSSLVPHNDPTLLFTNAGMNQFKDTFLGLEKRDYTRAVTSQKCVRAGGKHNDLDNVGYTARHHTFFEMLGNFSFGDYFKKDAIAFAWEFLTDDNWLALPKDRLYVTVYHTDDEAFDIWHKDIGLAPERIIRIGDKGGLYQSDNFWAMGDTGPCGPCSEIFYDYGEHMEGGLPGTPDEDGDRYVEIWNCVFMQFNRQKDGTLEPLPKPSVDTGMGLERISSVMQGKFGNYETDLFVNLMKATAQVIGVECTYEPSFKVIADHIRAVSFLIADGVRPSNEGRGYVLRRIIRRAVRHGNKLGAEGAFFHKIVPALVAEMGEAYPQLVSKQAEIEAVILKEEEQFAKTLAQGLRLLSGELENLKAGDTLIGETVFKLYDTYGFPVDLTADILREKGLNIDENGFHREMEAQRQRARESGKFAIDYNDLIKTDIKSEFVGYENLTADGELLALYQDGKPTDTLNEGDEGIIVLDKTPFYAESGGQVGEVGEITTATGVFVVEDTQKSGTAIIHYGKVRMGQIAVGQKGFCEVVADVRWSSAKNHSATHLLHAALREVLGDGVAQKGSLVSSQVLRFDFSYDNAISTEQLEKVEQIVNEKIAQNDTVLIEYMNINDAKAKGAMALFGEKYGEVVRVLTMGKNADNSAFSIELCGGIHIRQTGDIGLFKIVSEGSIASGIRRVEALTGAGALRYIQSGERVLNTLAKEFKAKREEVAERVLVLTDKVKDSDKQIEKLTQKLASFEARALMDKVVDVGGVPVLIAKVDGVDSKGLRSLADDVKSKLTGGVAVLASVSDGKIALTASVGKDLTQKVKAGDIIKSLCESLNGKGGGKPDFAQGGASKVDGLDKALADLQGELASKLA